MFRVILSLISLAVTLSVATSNGNQQYYYYCKHTTSNVYTFADNDFNCCPGFTLLTADMTIPTSVLATCPPSTLKEKMTSLRTRFRSEPGWATFEQFVITHRSELKLLPEEIITDYQTIRGIVKRYEIFKEVKLNQTQIAASNPYAKFQHDNKLGDHSGSDMIHRFGYVPSQATIDRHASGGSPNLGASNPGLAVDYTNCLTPIKDQGSCGSCWAFSSVEAIESSTVISTSGGGAVPTCSGAPAISISAQQLVDCDTSDGGCTGGDPAAAMVYAQNGLETDSSYPYTSGATNAATPCSASPPYPIAVQSSTTTTTEDDMLYALQNIGTVAIIVDATTWQSYAGGVMTACTCAGGDHAVQLVRYNPSDPDYNNQPTYTIRNSWGAGWGENGFLRVPAGVGCYCVGSEGVIVTGTKSG